MDAYRTNINPTNNLYDYAECKKILNNRTKFVGEGGHANVYKAQSSKCGSVVVKHYNKSESMIITEYAVMVQTNILVNKQICPNFILMVGFDYQNLNLIMEFADGSCEFLFKTPDLDTEIYISYYLQILLGLYVFQKALGLTHNDYKPHNILYKRIDPNTVFVYNINGKVYRVKTFGYLFMLADYGYIRSSTYIDNPINQLETEIKDLDRMNFEINLLIAEQLTKNYTGPDAFISLFDSNTQNKLKKLSYPLTHKTRTSKEWAYIELIYYTIEQKLLPKSEMEKYKPNHIILDAQPILLNKIPLAQTIDRLYKDWIGTEKINESDKIFQFSFAHKDFTS